MSDLVPYNHPDYTSLPDPFPHPHACAWGEDGYGIWCDMDLMGVTQRFRWIPAGEFTMGSPEDELDRDDDEALHEVTLTQGYWLADTACTQALWTAVMGENPSHFLGDDQRPVEKITWLDCLQFINKLKIYTDLELKLPSEAEWEYACRSGTSMPFSWGDNIVTSQVNYNGNYPYHRLGRELHRDTTVTVKGLPANRWGLYQMHGNVWEWCKDLFVSNLGGSGTVDPLIGSGHGDPRAQRVLRGGSWNHSGCYCRSAFRDKHFSDDHGRTIGVRFSIGSSCFELLGQSRGTQLASKPKV